LLQDKSAGRRNRGGLDADFPPDRIPQAAHHPLAAGPALPPSMEMDHQAEICHPEKQKKNHVRSAHGFDTTDG
jgi:hypothetical protein